MKLRTFQYYMADCAQLICNNVANGLGGNIIGMRFADLFADDQPEESAEEIKERIFAGLREMGELDGCI